MARASLPLAGVLLMAGLLAFVAADTDAVFYESFDDSWEGRWIVSESAEYQGKWKYDKSEGHDDYGLLASEKAKKYGIAVDLPKPVDFSDGVVVLQYDLRLQGGLECGGAYLKFLQSQEAGWTPSRFDNTAPYSIMFGPDKCGATNKVHFIFRHKNPNDGDYVEHHLGTPPMIINDKKSHVYTAVIYPNNTLSILIDGEQKKTADLLSNDFEPPVVPPKTIPDPEDVKPEEWDERAKISDPDASKPEDWDESAPREIEDEEAEKPEGWLDDEPDEVDDPEALKPEDWDDEEDGEWEPPKVENPLCAEAPGCGEWIRPTKRNPAYKGKWSAPLIDNPDFKGIWSPRDIPNVDYFEIDKPNFEPIAAVGIEIWTMQDGILFDNVLITHDETEAAAYRETTWKPKFEAEKVQEKVEEAKESPTADSGLFGTFKEKVFDMLYLIAEIPFLSAYKEQITNWLEAAEKHKNLSLGVLFGSFAVVLALFYSFAFGGKKKPQSPISVETAKKEDLSAADDVTEKVTEPVEELVEGDDGEIEKEEETNVRRRTRRET